MGYAARFTNDIKRDLERGYSFSGWGIKPKTELDEFIYELVDAGYFNYDYNLIEKFEDEKISAEDLLDRMDINYTWSEELGGYMPIESGLCAFYSNESEEDAIMAAVKDNTETRRFGDLPLYVFEAVDLGEDKTDTNIFGINCRIVKPAGEPKEIN